VRLIPVARADDHAGPELELGGRLDRLFVVDVEPERGRRADRRDTGITLKPIPHNVGVEGGRVNGLPFRATRWWGPLSAATGKIAQPSATFSSTMSSRGMVTAPS
jgi:hypothetical protein